MLAAHPDIISFPESHFFKLISFEKPAMESVFKKINIISRRGRGKFRGFVHSIGKQADLNRHIHTYCPFRDQYVKAFINILDELAAEKGKSFWLEKTPGHLRHIDYIETVAENAKFIHIIRRGENAVASMYEATNKYPKLWGGSFTVDECIDWWNESIRISFDNCKKPNHTFVSYESLLKEPRDILTDLCKFLEIDWDEAMLTHRQSVSDNLILGREPWKQSVKGPLRQDTSEKFLRLFDEAQREHIRSRLSPIEVLPAVELR